MYVLDARTVELLPLPYRCLLDFMPVGALAVAVGVARLTRRKRRGTRSRLLSRFYRTYLRPSTYAGTW